MAGMFGSRRRNSSEFWLGFRADLEARLGIADSKAESKPVSPKPKRSENSRKPIIRRAARVWIVDFGPDSSPALALIDPRSYPHSIDPKNLKVCSVAGTHSTLSEIIQENLSSGISFRFESIENLSKEQQVVAYTLMQDKRFENDSRARFSGPQSPPVGVRIRKKHRYWVAMTESNGDYLLVLGRASYKPKEFPIGSIFVCDTNGQKHCLADLVNEESHRVRFVPVPRMLLSKFQMCIIDGATVTLKSA